MPERRSTLEVALLEALLDLIDRCSSGSGSLHGNEAFLGKSWQHLLVDAAHLLGLRHVMFIQSGVPEKWIIVPMLNNRYHLVSITCFIICPSYCCCPFWWLECFVTLGYHLPVLQMPCPVLVSILSSYGHLEGWETISCLLILCVYLVEYRALDS